MKKRKRKRKRRGKRKECVAHVKGGEVNLSLCVP